MKYVINEKSEFVIFPDSMEHSLFKHLRPVAAGTVCLVGDFGHSGEDDIQVVCYGESISLKLKAQEKDSKIITRLLALWNK